MIKKCNFGRKKTSFLGKVVQTRPAEIRKKILIFKKESQTKNKTNFQIQIIKPNFAQKTTSKQFDNGFQLVRTYTWSSHIFHNRNISSHSDKSRILLRSKSVVDLSSFRNRSPLSFLDGRRYGLVICFGSNLLLPILEHRRTICTEEESRERLVSQKPQTQI